MNDWPRVRIGDIGQVFDGPHATPKPTHEGPVFLGIGNVTEDGHLDLSDVRHISELEYPQWTKRVTPRAGDIVFTYEATLNRYAIIPRGFRGCLGRRMALIRPNPDAVDGRFLFYSFFGPAWRETIEANRLSGATVDRIPIKRFPDFPVALPPLDTQRRIAGILGAYDDLIEVNRRRVAVLEAMARGLFEEWFVRFRFPGHEHHPTTDTPNGPLPEGWRWAPIKEAYHGLFDGPHATPAVSDDGPIFLGIGNITETGRMDLTSVRHISEDDFSTWTRRVMPQDGDIVFTYEATLNRYALIPRGFRGCLGRRLALIRADEKLGLNRYLFLYFFTDQWRETIAMNTLSGATVDRVPLTRFPDFPIILPDLEVVRQFDCLARPILEVQQRLAEANRRLAAARDALLPRLISGHLDLNTATRELETAA